jgi:Ca2+-binding RTX toxin-like protein
VKGIVAAAVVGLATMAAAPALAATAQVEKGELLVTAPSHGPSNDVSVAEADDYFAVEDTYGVIAGPGCESVPTPPAAKQTRCSKAGVTMVRIELGPGPDRGSANVHVPALIDGGPGNDEFLFGFDPRYPAPSPTTAIRGGPGHDGFFLSSDGFPYGSTRHGWQVSLRNGTIADPAGRTRLTSFSGIEDVLGSMFADTIIGDDAGNELGGGSGPDTIKASGGNDRIDATDLTDVPSHEGHPTYESWPDEVSCGPGYDYVQADLADTWTRDCEHVTVNGHLELNGDNRPNKLVGSKTLRTIVHARGGNDRIFVAGGTRDDVHCGSGRDRVVADRSDRIGRDCERVKRRR